MADSNSQVSGGISGLTALGLIFVTLKLTGHVSWPWVWVLCPFWIGPAILLGVLGTIALVTGRKRSG